MLRSPKGVSLSRTATLFVLLLTGLLGLGAPAAGQISGAPVQPQLTSAKDSQAIVARGILRVAITKFDLPAFHWRNKKGQHVGPEIDLARLIGRQMRVGVELIDDCPTFDAVIDAVASARADIGISKLSQTPLRILKVRFSDPYVTLRQTLLFNRSTIGQMALVKSPEEILRGFSGTIGVLAGSAYVDFAVRNFPKADLIELRTLEHVILALEHDRVDAAYEDEFEVRRVLQGNPPLNVRFGSVAFTDQSSFLSVAICETCARLQEFINYQINESRASFALSALLASRADN